MCDAARIAAPLLIVIAQSARMLAVSAARAGFEPVAVDLFADRDTRAVAPTIAISSLDDSSVLDALHRVLAAGVNACLVYGSGIDNRPNLVEKLALRVDVLGNCASVLRIFREPSQFFGLLDSLAIPYPAISATQPQDPESWLYKIPFTEGGVGVFPALSHPDQPQGYYQRKLEGPAFSALFLGNREEARIVGFNIQWTAGLDTDSPFLFGGIMNTTSLTLEQRLKIEEYVSRLVRSVSLVGLNSLDFMLDQGECKVLEVNPRPSSSMILYDRDFPQGLLAEHIRACQGLPLREGVVKPRLLQGLQIVFAQKPCIIDANLDWPPWATDRPMPGAHIDANAPICTVTASGLKEDSVKDLLCVRKEKILASPAILCAIS